MNVRPEARSSIMTLPTPDLSRDALLFDIDGTLLDIATRPADVHVPETLRRDLARLNELCDGAIALVSGRTLAMIDALFSPLVLATIGSHGAELRRLPDGPVECCAPPLSLRIREALADLGNFDPRIVVEGKTYTLAFHYRGARDRAAEFVTLVSERLKPFQPEFTMLRGKAIVEVKSASFSKGTAVRKLLAVAPFKGRRPIFCGDDTTDEDAFRLLSGFGGLGISVGREMAGATFTAPAPIDIRDWLSRIVAHKGGPA
jgi:trehalose 6-phosphate phosphatase